MKNEGSLRIRYSSTEREIIADNKLSDETEADFLRRLLNIMDLHPEILKEDYFTNPDVTPTKIGTEKSTIENNSDEDPNTTLDRIDSNISVLLEGLKVMTLAASKDNEDIQQIFDALAEFKKKPE